jgi:hypothetical protein
MDLAFICSICDKFILAGETMWSVNVHHEVSEDGTITVLDAESLYVFYEDCAQDHNFSNISIPLIDSNR